MRKRQQKMKTSLIYLFIFALVMSPLNGVFATMGTETASASDIDGHWAKDTLTKWIDNGDLEGYDDGTVRPNNDAKRSEIVTLINRALGYTETTDVSNLTDVKSSDWFYEQVQRAVNAGYIEGFEDDTFRPENKTTRQQVAVMIARILDLDVEAHKGQVNDFTDKDQIPTWSAGAIGAVADKGIMEGYPAGDFRPEGLIKRAEVVVTLDRAIALKEAEEVETTEYNLAGTYGPETGTETIEGNVIVSVEDVTLQNLVITGDLLLAEGIGEGDVTLKNVKVEGTTTVQGGGENSIHLIDTELFTVIVDKKEGNVRIVASGSTSIESAQLDSGAKLETDDVTGDGFKNVTVKVEDGEVILSGDFNNVEIDVPNANVNVEKGSIKQLNVTENAKDSKIEVFKDAEVETLKLDAATEVKGEGTIKKAEINVNGSKIEQWPEEIVIEDDVSVWVDGKEVKESTKQSKPPAAGGGGGGSGGDNTGGDSGEKSIVEAFDEAIKEERETIKINGDILNNSVFDLKQKTVSNLTVNLIGMTSGETITLKNGEVKELTIVDKQGVTLKLENVQVLNRTNLR